jgi:hypothetical protein
VSSTRIFAAGGLGMVLCEGWRHGNLVAFSCKGRGFCPSCASRRMAETGAKLLDKVLPALLSPVLGVVTRTLSTDVTHRAGYRRRDAGSGVVPFIQRVGSALTLNVHLQLLVPDGAGRFVTALRLDRWPVNAR